ncbi:Gfo/Idh/MocA family protein [Methylocapsa sp. S129]|uniref:Gfo/Idh/MocA family protein n=1 Tax=Methylocapsa sp. S129 TaxID=1641869 RepID=UPI00131D095C|nr:Gfo/Idh/MocA family oxidoreductase [Methylocapsa sp. S129]
MNVCMVGHGMMGKWHSENLRAIDGRRHTLVGVQPDQTAAFAAAQGYLHWTTDYGAALNDPEVDIVVIATPSELHAEQAIAALEHGKHVLVEIPIAMNLADAERVAATAKRHKRILGLCHPRRFGAEREALRQRVHAGAERVRLIDCRFFIHRLSNTGATGLRRDWTDNLLWHHVTHLVDFALWMAAGGDLAKADDEILAVHSLMSPVDVRTGIPMEVALMIEAAHDCAIVCTGSYYSRAWIYDLLVVTDRDSYRFDELKALLTTGDGEIAMAAQQEECAMALRDFVQAAREGRDSAVPGWSVLPTMRVLERVQQDWDRRHGARALPGRPLPGARG